MRNFRTLKPQRNAAEPATVEAPGPCKLIVPSAIFGSVSSTFVRYAEEMGLCTFLPPRPENPTLTELLARSPEGQSFYEKFKSVVLKAHQLELRSSRR